MSFLKDYLFYNSGSMVPERFTLWSAISILAATLGRRVYVDQGGYYQITPCLFIALIGNQGTRKGSAKDRAMDLFIEAHPDYPLAPSITSREKIIEYMASDLSLRVYQDENSQPIEWHPCMFFINELKNFMSFNPGAMIEFLTDIYDRKFFVSNTLKRGEERILNPCINILACETPQWIIDKLKFSIISGGFARRLLLVYVTERPPRITFPFMTPEMSAARERCKIHLQELTKVCGPFTWTPESREFFDHWFVNLKNPTDELLAGYYEAKDGLALKIAMCVAMAEYKPDKILTVENLQTAIMTLESIEPNLPKLSLAAGRNELAVPMQRVVEYVQGRGWMFERELKTITDRDLSPNEQTMIINHLREQERIMKVDLNVHGKAEKIVTTAQFCRESLESGKWKKNDNGVFTMNGQ